MNSTCKKGGGGGGGGVHVEREGNSYTTKNNQCTPGDLRIEEKVHRDVECNCSYTDYVIKGRTCELNEPNEERLLECPF